MIDHEIWALCKSDKNDACIGFGTIVSSETECFDLPGQEWIIDGIGDSFWENYDEFKFGITQAIDLMSKNHVLSRHDALFEIFGSFSINFEVDDRNVDLEYDIDINRIMYSMLEQLC